MPPVTLLAGPTIDKSKGKITAVVHMGACSATTETDMDFLMENNYEYTKKLWKFCTERNINYIYASSAATYGLGELGYDDDVSPEELKKLKPLNKYGYSKKFFDESWVLSGSIAANNSLEKSSMATNKYSLLSVAFCPFIIGSLFVSKCNISPGYFLLYLFAFFFNFSSV